MNRRKEDFEKIGNAIEAEALFAGQRSLVIQGDSLQILKRLPDACINLILTDPPYHATKKLNIYGDTAFAADKHYIEWMEMYSIEWRRVLRPNGSLFCFCDSSMAARLEVMFSERFNILSHIVWTKPNEPGFDGWKGKMKKESLRQFYPHSERVLFAEPAVDTNLFRSPFATFLKEARKQSGLTTYELAEKIGAYGKINHGGAVCNWEDGRNTPSREQYDRVRDALFETGKIPRLPPYEDAVRPFLIDGTKEYMDVWTSFPSVRPYKGKHPAEKPLTLLQHAVETTTYPEDIVLDCFGGSGSTAIAALKVGRRAVVIEIEKKWAEECAVRVQEAEELHATPATLAANGKSHLSKKALISRPRQLGLFSPSK